MINEKSLDFKCIKCGCVGLHACTVSPIVWTESDKEKLKNVLNDILFKDKK